MRAGRKRLTLFGLRPKYTSMMIAVLTGVLTAVATLGILSAVSDNVRTALFHLEQIRKENAYLNEENARVQKSLSEVSEKWRAARSRLDSVNVTLTALRDKITTLAAARTKADESLRLARADLVATGADLAKAKTQYTKVSGELVAARDEVKFIQQRKDNLESAIAILEKQIDNLSTRLEYLGTGVVDFATQPIILRVGEVLTASIVKPGKSFSGIEADVVDILGKADRIARERGASIENKNVGTRVDIKRLTAAYQVLFNLKTPAVLRVVSGTNTIAGKPAFVYLEVLEDTVVFRQGEMIAGIMVKGRNDADKIHTLISETLLPNTFGAVKAAGMVGPDGEAPWLELTFSDLEKAVKTAMSAYGEVRIKLAASRDLRRVGDRLSLSVEVEEAK
jgi:uncharacterized protein (DUF3084 family)